jgi:HAD superfamily hydrolase (TIGR01509 family)
MDGMSAVVFDLDNTLVDRDGAVAAWLAEVVPAAAVAACLRHDGGGYGDRDAFFASVATACGAGDAALRARFRAELPRHIRPLPGALALLERLRPRYRLAVATNGRVAMQRAKLEAAGIAGFFAHVVISDAIGVAKPAEAFFIHLLGMLSCPAAEVLMVGDHPRNDIAGAAGVGMRTCWLRSAHFTAPARADACIDALDQVPLR